MQHQIDAVEEARRRPFLALFYETGTGKTPIGLRVMEDWYVAGLRRFICIVPKPVTGNWIDEAELWQFPLRITRLPNGRAKRIALIRSNEWDVLVCGYEAMRTLADEIIARHPQGLLIDEIQRLKDRRSEQSKAAKRVAVEVMREQNGRAIGLTGTPVTHSPRDLWSEFDILYPPGRPTDHVLGYGPYRSFEQQICIVRPHPRLGNRVKLYEYPEDRLNALRARVAHLAIEKTKDECLDLPDRTFQNLYVDMDDLQAAVYKSLKEEFLAILERRPTSPEATEFLQQYQVTGSNVVNDFDPMFLELLQDDSNRVSVNMATTLMLRLQQIAAGFVRADNDTLFTLDNAKIALLEEMLPLWTTRTNKCILFHRFKYDVVVLSALCTKLGIKYVTLNGSNSDRASEIVKTFQEQDDVKVFIGNLQVASLGITLTAANYVAFYTNTFNFGDRLQALDRPYRYGQTRKVSYYDIVARNTVDETLLENQKTKRHLADMTVGNLKEMLRG